MFVSYSFIYIFIVLLITYLLISDIFGYIILKRVLGHRWAKKSIPTATYLRICF